MSGLRDEIRAILREEIAAITGGPQSEVPTSEAVRVNSSADLTRFAQDLLTRAQDPAFAARVAQGTYRFELEQHRPIGAPIVSAPAKPKPDALTKTLVAERDIGALGAGTTGAEHRQDITNNPIGARRGAAQGHSDRKE